MKDSRKGKNVFWKFLKLMGKPLALFLFAMVIHMVGDNFLHITLSFFVNHLIEMAEAGNMNGFPALLAMCIVANVIALLVFFIFGAIYDIEAKRGNAVVQRKTIAKALRMPMKYYDEHNSGEIVSKLLNDVDTASQIFTSRLRRVTTPLVSVIVYFIPMVILSPPLAFGLVLINVISLVINAKYIPKMKSTGISISNQKKDMTNHLSQVLKGIECVKMYPGAELLSRQYKNSNRAYSDVMKGYWKNISWLGTINTFFDMVCALGFLFLSLYFVKKGWCNIGAVAAIYTLYGSFSYNFLELGKYLPELMNCIARAQILFDFWNQAEESDFNGESNDKESKELEKIMNNPLDVKLEHVTFSYEERNVFSNSSMEMKGGKSTAITGKTGCGKSTLMKLLLGFYPINSGKITIGGNSICNMGYINVRQRAAYVPQNPYLFNESIKENIRYGKLEATFDEIVEAAKLANAHDFIMQLPEGYDTLIKAGGMNLSGGERQRIAIARAFIRNAPLILLDEATSALDNKNENEIQEALNRLMKDRTALVIAHRPATIASCDIELCL